MLQIWPYYVVFSDQSARKSHPGGWYIQCLADEVRHGQSPPRRRGEKQSQGQKTKIKNKNREIREELVEKKQAETPPGT